MHTPEESNKEMNRAALPGVILIIIIGFLMFMCSCSTLKRSHVQTTMVHDTLIKKQTDTFTREHTVEVTTRVHDTVLHFGGEHVEQHISGKQLAQAQTAVRDQLPQFFEVNKGILHQVVTVEPDGSLTITTNVDSIERVIQDLRETTSAQADTISRLSRSATDKSSVTSETLSDKVIKTNVPLWAKVALIIFILGAVAGWLIKMYEKHKIP